MVDTGCTPKDGFVGKDDVPLDPAQRSAARNDPKLHQTMDSGPKYIGGKAAKRHRPPRFVESRELVWMLHSLAGSRELRPAQRWRPCAEVGILG